MRFQYNDGGRGVAGFKGQAGDCVCRAIAIVTGLPYGEVYDRLAAINAGYRGRSPKAKKHYGVRTARNGVWTRAAGFRDYMAELGFTWTATMGIGTGCKVHLMDGELPGGTLIVSVSKHLTTVIDGVIHDTHDPQRSTLIVENGQQRVAGRCVYGYWQKRSS